MEHTKPKVNSVKYEQMPRITLFIPYFGSFPNYFQLYLDSLGKNADVLTVVLLTDIDISAYRVPENLQIQPMTLEILRLRIQAFLLKAFGHLTSIASIAPTCYKLCDFKIFYPLLFDEFCPVSSEDFVGWGDIDVIYGKLNQFVSDKSYDIVGGWHGHFTAIKNTLMFKQLSLTVPNIYKLCTDPSKSYATDEIAYRQPLVDFMKMHELKMCYLNATFCDIVPPCYYTMFRKDHDHYAKNFFNVLNSEKNISYLTWAADGRLTTLYDDGEIQETSYCHLQKRAMTVPEGLTSPYFITDSAFLPEVPQASEIIPRNLFMTWRTKTLPPTMQESLDRIRAMNPEFTIRLFDDEECKIFLLEHFPKEVAAALDALKPGAYKADLWRLCVLYIHGGIYMDSKLRPVDGVTLKQFLTREWFVSDGPYTDESGITLTSIYNGFMCCKAKNSMVLKAIVTIVYNVSKKYYGDTAWSVTGPRMLAPLYTAAMNKEPLYLTHYGPTFDTQYIECRKIKLFENYANYRKEVPADSSYYQNQWKQKDIYEPTITIDFARIKWPSEISHIVQPTNKIRLHLPAVPYTITRDEYSHDAFTGKVKRFAPMMQSLRDPVTEEPLFEVYHYGVETSESDAACDIQLMTKAEWHNLRIESLQFIDKTLTREAAETKLSDPTILVGTLANWDTPLFKEFNNRFRTHLQQNYRNTKTDIVCIPLGHSNDSAFNGLDLVKVEFGIGYSGSCMNYRIFESYSWMAKTLGEEKREPNNYWFVIPHGFDISAFKFAPIVTRPRIGFLGRIGSTKGCYVIAEVAKLFPNVDFILCGQGDYKPFMTSPNIHYKEPIHGSERSDYLGSCIATMCPTVYLEPFGCSAIESQLCGTPVISVDNGGYVETVEQFKTGLRCHTLADYCKGVQMALDGAFDRAYVRERAVRLYDMYGLAKQYEYVFRSVLDIHTPGKNGWYSPDCHMPL
jgi:mannosyltransferase OCH1-like enzyme